MQSTLTPLAAGLALLFAVSPALPQTSTTDAPTTESAATLGVTDSAEFLRLATSANILEIRSSELARDRATSPEVKAFAEQMITDHTAAATELASLTGTPQPDLATDLTAMLDPKHADLLGQLDAVDAAGFDASYADLQRQAHEQAIALFQGFATDGEAGALKDFAAKTLPKLQEHLEKAEALIPTP